MPISIDFHSPDLTIRDAIEQLFNARPEDWYGSATAAATSVKTRLKIELRATGFKRSADLEDCTPDSATSLLKGWLGEYDSLP